MDANEVIKQHRSEQLGLTDSQLATHILNNENLLDRFGKPMSFDAITCRLRRIKREESTPRTQKVFVNGIPYNGEWQSGELHVNTPTKPSLVDKLLRRH
jgi:hypothetical protein